MDAQLMRKASNTQGACGQGVARQALRAMGPYETLGTRLREAYGGPVREVSTCTTCVLD